MKTALISGLLHATISSDTQIHAVLSKHTAFMSSLKNLVSWYFFSHESDTTACCLKQQTAV